MTDETSPREYLSAAIALVPRALRALWIGGIVLVIGLGVTVAWTLSTDHLYRSEAVVAYDHGVRTSTTVGMIDGDSPREISGRLRDMLTSRQRFEKIIKELNLYRRIAERHGMGEAIDEMKKHVLINSREDMAYRVSFDAAGRELAQRGLELLVNGVVEEDAQRRVREADETKHFLDAERKHADEDLKTKESALAGFLAAHPVYAHEAVGAAAAAGGAIRGREPVPGAPASSSAEVAQLELQAAQIEEALAAAGVHVAATGPVDAPPLVAARERARAELQTAQRALTEKQAMYTNEHPDVKAAIRHVAMAEAAFHRAEASVEADRAGQKQELPAGAGAPDDGQDTARTAALKHALGAIRSQIASVKSRAVVVRDPVPTEGGSSSPVATDIEWTRLNRDVAEARERQVQLQGKQFQAELMATLAGGGQGGRLVVIDPPFRPVRPITGGRFKIAGAGLAASIVLSLLTIVLFAAFDDRLYGDRDIHRIVKDGIVVVIPQLTGKIG